MTLTAVRRPAQSGTSLKGDYTSVPLANLKLGVTLRHPIYDPCGLLLIAAGLSLTATMLERLKNRGVLIVRIHREEANFIAPGFQNNWSDDQRDNRSTDSDQPAVSESGYQPLIEQRFRRLQNDIACQTTEIHNALAKGRPLHFEATEALAKETFKTLKIDQDLSLNLSSSTPSLTLASHSTNTATIAMSIAKTMNVSIRDVLSLGAGCLLHDSGMLKVKEGTRELERRLTPAEFVDVTKHVGASHDMISGIKDMPPAVRRVAVEMHERVDGRGYPRSKSGNQMHPLSRIAAVADCFAAMVSPRPYRDSIPHYQAMQYLLYRTRTGRFDSAVVRALLETVSLFPIGSYVCLNDQRIGRVIRANGSEFTRPVVAILDFEGNASGEPVDLKRSFQLEITDVLPNRPTSASLPLTQALAG